MTAFATRLCLSHSLSLSLSLSLFLSLSLWLLLSLSLSLFICLAVLHCLLDPHLGCTFDGSIDTCHCCLQRSHRHVRMDRTKSLQHPLGLATVNSKTLGCLVLGVQKLLKGVNFHQLTSRRKLNALWQPGMNCPFYSVETFSWLQSAACFQRLVTHERRVSHVAQVLKLIFRKENLETCPKHFGMFHWLVENRVWS